MIALYDTTLRDGEQREGVNLTVEDKLRIAARLDALGIAYIEGGFPASNPTDSAFYQQMTALEPKLEQATISAFGTTLRKGAIPEEDEGLRALATCPAPVVTLVGKAWELQASEALGASGDENLRMVELSVRYLVQANKRVFFDAEHFFDGYKDNSDYALASLLAAGRAGAEVLVLCDTNGGSLPHEVYEITASTLEALKRAGIGVAVGIHAHDDSGCAVANSLEAVLAGATQVQGTINGFGERVGNANLLTIIANMKLKMGLDVVSAEQLAQLTSTAHLVAETFNVALDAHLPYVGQSAFSHKGGIHASATLRHRHSYEHIDPATVGNFAHIVISELAGKASLVAKGREMGLDFPDDEQRVQSLLDTIKLRESKGYSYEVADASFALLLRAQMGEMVTCFTLESFRVIAEKREDGRVMSEATIKLMVGGKRHVATGEGNGPVNALDAALRLAIQRFYPQVESFELTDYKVRVLDESIGTGAVTRVLIETSDGQSSWGTVGVSDNIIEASWDALVDAITYGLLLAGR
ncbi:MAG: citramalate synthase [Coriobacteriales bacterium]|nr:citramalate synthase [Coriobacteriales bacterium]